MELALHQSGFRWSAAVARAKRGQMVSNPDRCTKGAQHFGIFSWSSGVRRGSHVLDEFRAGAWVIGVAQEANDPGNPEPIAEWISHLSASASRSWADLLEEEEEERHQAELLRAATGEIESEHVTDDEDIDVHGYNQGAYMESLGFNVVSNDGNMVYVRSHACRELNLLESRTIRSHIDPAKWDMCRTWRRSTHKHSSN